MDGIKPLLEELAKSLGTTVENLWRILLQQVRVETQIAHMWMNIALWGGGILLVLCVIAFFLGMVWNDRIISQRKNGVYTWSSGDDWIGVSAFGLIGFILVLIIAGIIYYSNYINLMTLQGNPEYWAVEKILDTIKGATK